MARESFDVIWVIECLEHLGDKSRFLKEAASLLRPGGRLALCSWQRSEGQAADPGQVQKVCDAFLCPGLATPAEHRAWCEVAGLEVIHREDLTAEVRQTWDVLIRRVESRWLAALRLFLAPETRRFLAGFPAIARAYESGAMTYGLLVAVRGQGNPRRRA